MDADSKLAAGWRSNWKLGLGQGNLGAYACHSRGRRPSENEQSAKADQEFITSRRFGR